MSHDAEDQQPTTSAEPPVAPPVVQQANEGQPSEPAKPEFRVYRPPQSTSTSIRELPDDYFQPSAADLRAAQSSLAARREALSNAPLKTQAMREAEDKVKRAKYPNTKIRVRFPDRTQLEKTFPSSDKIKSVYAFVRGCLREDVKPIKFVLYQTPPKRELKVSDPNVRDLSLFELQLAPSSVLHLKFLEESLNHVTVPAPLDSSVLEKAEDLPIPPDPESNSASAASTPGSSSRPNTASTLGQATGQVKMPKWLKLPGKK